MFERDCQILLVCFLIKLVCLCSIALTLFLLSLLIYVEILFNVPGFGRIFQNPIDVIEVSTMVIIVYIILDKSL